MTATTDHSLPASQELKWYVLKVQTNREKSIREALQRRINRDGMQESFGKDEKGELKIVIATEKIVETKSGKRKVVERKLYPGYLFIQMILNDETWYLVRDTSGVGDFTAAAETTAAETIADGEPTDDARAHRCRQPDQRAPRGPGWRCRTAHRQHHDVVRHRQFVVCHGMRRFRIQRCPQSRRAMQPNVG